MTFYETLELSREYGINYIDLAVAVEVEFKFENVSKEEFEVLCYIAKEAYLKSEGQDIEVLVYALYEIITTEKIKLEELSKHDIIEYAYKVKGWWGKWAVRL